MIWVAMGLYHYGGMPDHLSILVDTRFKFPVFEPILIGACFCGFASFYYFRNDKGETLAERGLDSNQHQPGGQTVAALLCVFRCHQRCVLRLDLTAADLLGRYLLKGGETVWIDGPLTRAVRAGAVCYLDEIVEARADTTVAIHALTDYRRELYVERLGVTLRAAPEFMLVTSYNPGYQSILKDLKPSTRQRMVSIELGFPPPDIELEVILKEAGVDKIIAEDLVRLGSAVRQLDVAGLPEVSSTRSLIAVVDLVRAGLHPRTAVKAAMIGLLCDDHAITDSLMAMVATYLP